MVSTQADVERDVEVVPSPLRGHLLGIEASVSRRKPLLAGPQSLNYGELLERVPRFGPLLEKLSVRVGDRAVILAARDDDFATLFFGLTAHGVTAVLLNPEAPATELESLIEAADPGVVFADEAVIDNKLSPWAEEGDYALVPIAAERDTGGIGGLFRRRSSTSNETFPEVLGDAKLPVDGLPDIDAETIAYILFTSGTTSRPKGVQISHRSLYAQMDTFVRQYGLTAESNILNILPLFHTDGVTHGVVVAMTARATVHRPLRFSVERITEILDTLYREKISHYITVPSVLALIRQVAADYEDAFDYPEFRFVISTAAYLDEALWRDFQDGFGVRVVNVYGLTETVCEACYCGPDDDSFRIGTVGKPVDCEARVVDENGREVAAGTTGELELRGDNIMAGYFRMPEATAEVLHDGWFATGDLATIDADGFVRIVGRKKSVIVTGAHNVYPEDVNNTLRSIDGVLDAATFGMEDAVRGEKVVACVVPAEGSSLTVEFIAKAFLERASREQLPRDIHIVDDLPRGPSGKVVLAEVRKIAESLTAAPGQHEGADVETTVYALAAEAFKLNADDLTPDAGPGTARAWTSLAHVEFLLAIESAFSIKLEARDIMNIGCLQDAVDVVTHKLRD
ncbi:MAG: AMP-binding protein [Woeseiaceae bacterium]|nr:AMP-binding protein [Woeseiaceae bacterium]